MTIETCDLAVVGAGAAGLFTAIHAGRRACELGSPLKVIAFDGAKKLGAKILVAGGGRCNVTHHAVDESAYAGSTPNAIKQVLRRFSVAETVEFFADLGVELKREDTGKLFPTTDRAQTVLDALLTACRDAGIELRHPQRVGAVEHDGEYFTVLDPDGSPLVRTRRLALTTGGKALPRTGSDGQGYSIAKALGHSTTDAIFPALVPLVLSHHWAKELSGVTLDATVAAHASTGKRLFERTNSTLCTHFGLSGPGILDASRYYLAETQFEAEIGSPGHAELRVGWLADLKPDAFDAELAAAGGKGEKRSIVRTIGSRVPERVARAICDRARLAPATPVHALSKQQRRAIVQAACADPVPVERDRGYTFAEVTAGGVPLSELKLKTMESKPTPGLHLAGEILDVDGRIGGFNFQWAWASGYTAGRAAAESLLSSQA